MKIIMSNLSKKAALFVKVDDKPVQRTVLEIPALIEFHKRITITGGQGGDIQIEPVYE